MTEATRTEGWKAIAKGLSEQVVEDATWNALRDETFKLSYLVADRAHLGDDDREELVQWLIVKVGTDDKTRATIAASKNPLKYVRVTLSNRIADLKKAIRRSQRGNRVYLETRDRLPLETPLAAALRSEVCQQVHDALDRLPADFREVIELYYFQGLSKAQVAERIGITPGAARIRLQLALLRIQATYSP